MPAHSQSHRRKPADEAGKTSSPYRFDVLRAVSGGCGAPRASSSLRHLIKDSLPGQTGFLKGGVGRTRLFLLDTSTPPDGRTEGATKRLVRRADGYREGVGDRLLHGGKITQDNPAVSAMQRNCAQCTSGSFRYENRPAFQRACPATLLAEGTMRLHTGLPHCSMAMTSLCRFLSLGTGVSSRPDLGRACRLRLGAGP